MFPDCQKYFMAAQLVTVVWWLVPDASNPAAVLEAAVVRSVEHLPLWGPKAPYDLTPSMLTTLRAWKAGLGLETESLQMFPCGTTPPYLTSMHCLTPKYGPNAASN